MKVKSESKLLSHVRLLVTPWTAAHQAPPSMGFSRQEYWSGVLLPSPREAISSLNISHTYYAKCICKNESVQSLSHLWLFATPWTAAHQASLSITNSWNLFKLMSIESAMPSNHLILCCPLLLLPSIFPSIRVFSKESVLHIRWPKYWSFSFSISPSNEYSGLIFLRIDWFDLLEVQGILKSFLQHHSSKASIFQHSAFFVVQLSHPYMTTGKTIAFTRQIFVYNVSVFNMLSRLVIAFLPRSKHLLTSWLQSPSAVTLESKKIKSSLFPLFSHLFAMKYRDQMPWSSFFECWVLSSFFTLLFHFHQEAL